MQMGQLRAVDVVVSLSSLIVSFVFGQRKGERKKPREKRNKEAVRAICPLLPVVALISALAH